MGVCAFIFIPVIGYCVCVCVCYHRNLFYWLLLCVCYHRHFCYWLLLCVCVLSSSFLLLVIVVCVCYHRHFCYWLLLCVCVIIVISVIGYCCVCVCAIIVIYVMVYCCCCYCLFVFDDAIVCWGFFCVNLKLSLYGAFNIYNILLHTCRFILSCLFPS